MAVVSMIVFGVIFQQCLAVVGEATVDQTSMQIIEGSDICANTGDELTLNCVVFAPITTNRAKMKWLFKSDVLAVCDNLRARIGNESSTTCNVTVTVGPAAEGVYFCQLTIPDDDRPMNVKTADLSVNNCDHLSTMQLLDPPTGAVLDEPEYGPVCIQFGTTRRFECRIQGARPAQVWDFTWIMGTHTIAAESEVRTTADGLVNVSSWHVVRNPGDGTRENNLTCLATSGDRSLNTTVLITVCAGGNRVVIAVATVVSIVTLVVLATLMIVKCRRKWREQLSVKTSHVQSSVEMDVASALDDPARQPGQSGVHQSPGEGFEDRTAEQGPHKYEDRIAQQGPHKYEDPVAKQGPHKYEDTIAQQGAHKYEDPVAKQGPHQNEDTISEQGPHKYEDTIAKQGLQKYEDRIAEQGPHKYEDTIAQQGAHKYEDTIAKQGLQKYEDRIAEQGLHKYENTIAQQGPHKYEDTTAKQGLQKYEDRIAERGPHKYEDTIAQQGAHKYEDPVAKQGPHQNEDTISEQGPHKYEGRIAPQVTSKYEYKITQNVAHQDTMALQVEYDDTVRSLADAPMAPDTEVDENCLPLWAESWLVPRRDVIVDEQVLGRGNFGEVRSGVVVKDGRLIRAAIKMLKGHASAAEKDDFMDEFHTMTSIGHHPNVVSLLGACQHREVLYVALEYLSEGDLRSYLRTFRSKSDSDNDVLASHQLVKFALDVAKGMEHLAKTGVIHHDLAARNILLSEELAAKVSDFGLSRGEDIYVQTSKRRVPARWLAIESMTRQKYTTKSDVWSFGILLWEIATLGGTPYPATRSEALARKLKGGYRMPKPSNCDQKSYTLMRKCWEGDPNNRPSFSDLVSILQDMDDRKIEHTYFLPDRLHSEELSAIRPEFDDN